MSMHVHRASQNARAQRRNNAKTKAASTIRTPLRGHRSGSVGNDRSPAGRLLTHKSEMEVLCAYMDRFQGASESTAILRSLRPLRRTVERQGYAGYGLLPVALASGKTEIPIVFGQS